MLAQVRGRDGRMRGEIPRHMRGHGLPTCSGSGTVPPAGAVLEVVRRHDGWVLAPGEDRRGAGSGSYV